MSTHKGKVDTLLYYTLVFLHVVYAVLFSVAKIKQFVWINVLLTFIYLSFALGAYKGVEYKKRFSWCFAIVALSTAAHYCVFGPRFGFQYISICIIPIIFYFMYNNNQPISASKKAAIGVFILFFAVMFGCSFIEYPLMYFYVRLVVQRIILVINIIMSFTFAIKFMIAFVSQVLEDTGTLENLNVDLENKANIDALTGVRNRRSVELYIEKQLHLAKAEGKDFAMFMCDIDDFKKVNDTYGHDCGDQVLKNIAKIIVGEIRPSDAIFRWGGEEFLLIINAKGSVANMVAERCRKAIENSSVVYNDTEIKVTITIGGVVNYQGATRDDLINRADENLYKGKHNGKNQVVMSK